MKKLVSFLLCLLMLLASLSGCSGQPAAAPEETAAPAETPAVAEPVSAEPGTWAIYWYLCGTDLESEGGAATNDLNELLQVQLPENVKVIIQTGGTEKWQNEVVDPNYIERFVYDSTGLNKVAQLPLSSMGDPATLADFLSFASTNYPAEKQMMLFWNHGGGSVSGAAFDQLYENDSLTLAEMYQAFGSVFTPSAENPPFEVVGFDTCLMATLDTAYTFSDIGKYLVASEEVEPGNGWNYTGFMGALAENTAMTGAELGQIICDTYVVGCEDVGTQDKITLSVTDLSKVQPLLTAYDNMGKEALSYACADPSFFADLGRSAGKTENYGGNTKDQGYTNMVDLGDLARNSANILPENQNAVLSSLDDCIVYKVNGPYRQQATGLSCYYSYNGDVDDLNGFIGASPSVAFKYLYAYEITGTLPADGMEYISEMQYEELPEIPTIENANLQDAPLTVDDQGSAILDIGADNANILTGVYFELFYADIDSDTMYLLGRDNDIVADWETGVFKDNFRGVWGAIDGHLVYMELNYEGDDYNLYNVPILINGEEYNLSVAYSFTDEAYSILGANKPIDESGMADKNLVQLQEGDEITTLHYSMPISGESTELTQVQVDTFTVTADTSFAEMDMGDGMFVMVFEMTDINENTATSETAVFTVENGEITTSVGN